MPISTHIVVLLIVALLALPVSARPEPMAAPAGVYMLDAERSRLTARAPLLGGLYRYPLTFRGLGGRLEYHPAEPARSEVTITVDPRALEAPDRAGERAALALFEPARYPAIDFRSRSYRPAAGRRGVLAGDLTLHGVTRPLDLDVTLQDVDNRRLRFVGKGKVRRSAHGMTSGRLVTGDVIDLAFEVEFVRK